MFWSSQQHCTLTAIVIIKTFAFVYGHGLCVKSLHVDQESNRYYRSFMHLATIGEQQCLRVCKRYTLCEKIHHNREQLTCDLMMTYEEKGDETSLLDLQSVQTDISDCDICTETEVCVGMENGRHICFHQEVCPAADWVPFNHKCYFIPGQAMTADENVEFCGAMNTTLVRIDNAGVSDFFKMEMTNRGITHMWISANDRAVENEWVWGPGDKILNAMWSPTEPNNNKGIEDCVMMVHLQSNICWEDYPCYEHKAQAVCEVHFEISP